MRSNTANSCTDHGSPGLDEPVKSELWGLTHSLPQFIIHVLFVEAQFVQHAHKEAILLLSVVLPLVCPILDAQLVKRGSVPRHLSAWRNKQAWARCQMLQGRPWIMLKCSNMCHGNCFAGMTHDTAESCIFWDRCGTMVYPGTFSVLLSPKNKLNHCASCFYRHKCAI